MNRDLTVGNVGRVLTSFAVPLLLSMVFQQLYNIADSLVAGKFLGEQALAAVGNSYEITLIFIAFAFGCNMGASVIVSQYFGAKRFFDMKKAVSTSYISTLVLCAALTGGGILFSDPLLALINTPAEIMEDSALYLDIYVFGLVFLFFYNLATGIFSAMGDSRTPFVFLALSSTANIFADVLFVTVFHMGVDGVAWATFICQGVSCVVANIALARRLSRLGIPSLGKELFDFRIFRRFVSVAVPSILQQSFVSVGNIVLQGLINGFGYSVIAGYSAAIKLNNLIITSITTLANAVSAFSAQNIGAGDFGRVRSGWRCGLMIAWAFSVPVIILFSVFGSFVLTLFLDRTSTEAMSSAMLFLRIVSPFYLVVSVKLISDAVLRGSGDMRPFMYSTFSDLILRVLLAFLFSSFLGSVGIWLSWPVGWGVGTLLSFYYYKSGHYQKRLLRSADGV